jgi:chromosome segregation ATPase
VCNNRINHQTCEQDYIRADVLEQSLLTELGKLADKHEVVSGLVREFTTERMAKLPDLEARREAARKELARVQKEREKLTRWVLSSTPTPQGVGYLNSEVDRLAEAEGAAQERLWSLEDQINGLELATYNAQGVCKRMASVLHEFPNLDAGERRLWAQCWIEDVAVIR